MDIIKQDILHWLETNTEEFYETAEFLWKNPEISTQEYRSSKRLSELLKKHGFMLEEKAAGMPTSFIATYGLGEPIIGINVEYDALPGLSQKSDRPVRSSVEHEGPGHGCGHNILGTAMVKAGIALRYMLEKYELSGTIVMFGAPAEELCMGKAILGKEGKFSNIDVFLDWHPWSYNRADYDTCNAYFSVKYHFKGKTAHGNAPWHGRSALDAAILQGHAVELLREHLPPGNPPDAANTLNYTFSNTGPEFPSVVPDKASAWYVGRFTTSEEAENAFDRLMKCAEGAALATETTVETEVITATNSKIPNKTLAEVVNSNFVQLGAPQFTDEEQEIAKAIQCQMGVEETGISTKIMPFAGGSSVVCDTSEYSWHAPYATAWVAMAPEHIGWHNWAVTFCATGSISRKTLEKGAQIVAASAVDLLCNPQLVKAAKEEFASRLGGKKYKCLLPKDYDVSKYFMEEEGEEK